MSEHSTTPVATPIAIVGLGALFPNAAGLKQYWRLLRRGEDAIREVPPTHWSPADYVKAEPGSADMVYCGRGGFLNPTTFDPVAWGVPPTILEATDTAQLLSLVVGKQALEDAGYGAGREFDRARASVILGVTSALEALIPLGTRLGHPKWRRALEDQGVEPDVAQRVIDQIAAEYPAWQENSFPGLLGNVVAGRIANRLNLKGTNCVVDAACASSLSAIHLASLELAAGRSDVVLTGGVDTFNDIFMFMCFSKTQALSKTGDCRPFAASADGTVLGEGIGMLVLKRLADAERDGDRIYAVLKGVGTSSDGRSQSIYAPLAEGQTLALRDAYRVSGVDPATIELVEAHGTGTAVGDAVEVSALDGVYRSAHEERRWCALGSVKGQIGHTKSAAGAASMVKAVLALHKRVIPPTIKVEQPNPKLDGEHGPFYLPPRARPWFAPPAHPRRAAVSSFGFGGSNFHAVLEEYGVGETEPNWDGSCEIIALSADDPARLREQLVDWRAAAQRGFRPNELANRAADSRRDFDPTHAYRLVIVAEFEREPLALLAEAEAALAEHGIESAWQTRNVFFGTRAAPGALALLFPGQGSQYVDMGREALCQFPEARDTFEAARSASGDGIDLADIVFPAPTFNADEQQRQTERLTHTQHAQPALGAVSLAMLRVLERFGIKPDMTAGHSFGELTALAAAGRIGDAALNTLARLRGKLMGQAAGATPEPTAMLAVQAPLEDIERALADGGHDAVLANRNAPRQGIVAGLRRSLDGVAGAFQKRGWATRWLNVSAAFHSRFMTEAAAAFREAMEEIRFELGRIPVFSNVTAKPYPDSISAMRDLLAKQLTHPVQFVDQIRHMYEAGARTFIEVGPKAVLTGLTRTILEGKRVYAAALDASTGKANVADLARVLACVAALGHAVELQAWEKPEPVPPDPKMAVELVGANYRAPRVEARRNTASVESSPTKSALGAPDPSRDVPNPVRAITAPLVPPASAPQPNIARKPGCGQPGSEPNLAVPVPAPHESIAMHNHSNGNTANGAPSNGQAYGPAGPLDHAAAQSLGYAYQVVQEGLRAMQALQQQTAQAHERFLHAQEQAQRSFQAVMESQRVLMERTLGLPAAYVGSGPPQAVSLAPPPPPPRYEPAPMPSCAPPAPPHYAAPAIAPVAEFAQPPPRFEPAPVPAYSNGNGLTHHNGNGASNGNGHHPAPAAASPAYAAPAAPAHAAATHIPASATAPADELSATLVTVVAELTGYPQETIELDMDLEADLGIDSIKRLEILGEMQRRMPGLGKVDSQYLGSLRTLRDIVASMAGPPASGAAPPPVASPSEFGAGEAAPAPIARSVLAAVPAEEGPQRPFDFGPGREIVITQDAAGLAAALVERFAAAGVAARVIDPVRAESSTDWAASAGGLILLGAGGESGGAGVSACQPAGVPARRLDRVSVAEARQAFHLTRTFLKALHATSATPFTPLLATIARIDGAFGLRSATGDTAGGAFAGLAKTSALEHPALRVRAFDVDPDWRDASAAAAAVLRALQHDGPLELGLSPSGPVQLELQPQSSLAAEPPPPRLAASDVIIVSGGARGVTADCAIALARETRATFVLLGRSPAPQPDPDWLSRVDLCDPAAAKRALLEQARREGRAPRPAELEAEYQRRLASHEIDRTLAAIEAVGGRATYESVDVRDAAAVQAMLGRVRATHGPIRGLIHGAGVLADKRIVDLTDVEFDRVLETKVAGAEALLAATRGDDLSLLVMFSSVAARFGNAGQAAYAMANEILNKLAQREARRRPECRVRSLNWGPWEGGMVTPALQREFERRGVELIPLAAGARAFVHECLSGGPEVEVVLGARISEGPRGRGAEGSSELVAHESALIPEASISRQLSVTSTPFLVSHRVKDRLVLPLAMALEWMSDAVATRNPGSAVTGLDQVRVFSGVVLDETESTRIRVEFDAPEIGAHGGVAAARLLRHGVDRPAFAARVWMGPVGQASTVGQASPPVLRRASLPAEPLTLSADEVYDLLFHGPHFRAICSAVFRADGGIVARINANANPADWVVDAPPSAWRLGPMWVDAALQLGLLWTWRAHGCLSLPMAIASFDLHAAVAPRGDLTLTLELVDADDSRLLGDVRVESAAGDLLATLRGVAWTIDRTLTPGSAAHRDTARSAAPMARAEAATA